MNILEKDRFLILVNFQRAVTKFYYAMAVEVSKKQEFMTKQSRF